jgi:disulfide oxidoreductase YuzD
LTHFLKTSAIILALFSGSSGCNSDIETPSKPATNNNVSSEDKESNSKSPKKIFVKDSIFQQLEKVKKHFPLYPSSTMRQSRLSILGKDNKRAYVIEDVHTSSSTYEILTLVLKTLNTKNPNKTLFILEGIKPNEKQDLKLDNIIHPNQFCYFVARENDAVVVNPIANLAQWSLVSEVLEHAQKNKFTKEEALGTIVNTLISSSPKELVLDVSLAVKDLKTEWGAQANIQEMYESANIALDANDDTIKNFLKKINPEDISDWTKISKLIEQDPSKKQEIIGLSICLYASVKFGTGKYPDVFKGFKKMQKLWGNNAPNLEELHNAWHQGFVNGFETNNQISQIIFSIQNKYASNGIKDACLKYNPDSLVIIAGYLHAPGIYEGLKSSGYSENH